MTKVYYKIESKHSKSNDWVATWSAEFETVFAAIEVLFEYLVNRSNSGDNCHYKIVKYTGEDVLNTENVIKKKLIDLI